MRIKIDSFADGFNLLDPLAAVVLLEANSTASSNSAPYFPNGAEGAFVSAAAVYWSYTGFDMVATMAEETRNPSRDVPIGLVGSMSIITVIYCLMALALTGMVKYTEIDASAAYVHMCWDRCLDLAMDSSLSAEVFHRMITAASWMLERGRSPAALQ
ncbi:hypothetical protein NC653_039721 [Populus alba x Populus x berolinensis]|uniref:Uncharacterized protein n=1 Tax=Populus alba x Populus x berolinensis TaxID=444605 RepID=A0AAD6LDE8_9ROSI|nr:hypothetical protein NC653_039721 [Populus alba x Populus x berolinensis]